MGPFEVDPLSLAKSAAADALSAVVVLYEKRDVNANAKSAEGLASVKPVFAQAGTGGTRVVEPIAVVTAVDAMSDDLVPEASSEEG